MKKAVLRKNVIVLDLYDSDNIVNLFKIFKTTLI